MALSWRFHGASWRFMALHGASWRFRAVAVGLCIDGVAIPGTLAHLVAVAGDLDLAPRGGKIFSAAKSPQ
jgi:hypothetical protein